MLLPAARQGNSDARNDLFLQLQQYLRWVAHRQFDNRLQNKLGESDVVQQSYLRAVERFDDFRGDNQQQLKAWLREILTNEVRQVRRSLRAEKRDWQRERPVNGHNDASGSTNGLIDQLPTPGTQALAKEQSAAVHAALERLSDDHRAVIELRNWQKLPFGEIAEQMGRTENAVTKLWFRALVRLQEELESHHESRE